MKLLGTRTAPKTRDLPADTSAADLCQTRIQRQDEIIDRQAETIIRLTRQIIDAEQARADKVATELLRLAYGISGVGCSFEEWRAERLDLLASPDDTSL